MKSLLLGNEAVARGLYEAGCKFVSSYPGTPSTEVTETLAKYDDIYAEWAPNEKVAAESAFGASLGGVRSCCAMKHVGLNVAADPLFTMSYTGVNAGMVIIVADDPSMHSSQNEQDSRHYSVAAKIPMLEPSDSRECYEFAKLAFEISEKYDTPVLLRLCTRISHSQSIVETGERVVPEPKQYVKDASKYVMVPANAKRRHPIVEERSLELLKLSETTPINRVEWGGKDLGIIAAGTSYQYAKEVFGDTASILKLGMVTPPPNDLICDFADKVEKVVVLEELDPIIESHCHGHNVWAHGKDMLGFCGEYSQNIIAAAFGMEFPKGKTLDESIPARPPVLCAGCPHRGMFYTLSKNKITVIGDIGCYTLGAAAPLSAMDMTLCMGASVSGLHGFEHAFDDRQESRPKAVAVIGDSTFMHSGMTGLANIAYNGSPSTVIILDNSITGMTGHQQNPTTGLNIKGDPVGKVDLEALCRAMGITRIRVVDPYDLKACDEAVREETANDEPSVIISRRPCALLKTVKPKPALNIDPQKCRGCKSCMKLGCPALSFKDNKAVVDGTLCIGCGICTQMCAFGAFEGEA